MQAIKWEEIDEPGDGRFELPKADGFVVRITGVKDDEPNQKIVVTYDIAEGPHAGIFAASEFATRNAWLHEFEVGYGTEWNQWQNKEVDQKPRFKRFFTNIEKSNPGYRFDGVNPQGFVGKLVGVVFKDHYKTNDRGYDDHRWYFVRSYEAEQIRKGDYKVPAPVDKRVARDRPNPFAEASEPAGYDAAYYDPIPFR